MRAGLAQDQGLLEYGVASVMASGEIVCGDLHLVYPHAGGALVAAVDGAGHGIEAARAARIAVATLTAHADQVGVIPLIERCHAGLKNTRGAVIGLAAFCQYENTLTWLGVGNIDGLLVRASESPNENRRRLLQRPGMVGYRLPALQAMVLPIAAGDLLILTTDGIQDIFGHSIVVTDSPQTVARSIVKNFHKSEDDGLVLVVRYVGSRK